MFCKDEVIKIFCIIDDFCKEFNTQIKILKQPVLTADQKTRNRKLQMSTSEILTIMICFHLGAHKTFKHYYQQAVQQNWSDLFPATLSYNRFIEIRQRYFVVLSLFLKERCLGKCTGISFVVTKEQAATLIAKDPHNKDVLFSYLNGEDLNTNPDQSPSRWVINFFDWPEDKARTYPDCFEIVERLVKPERKKLDESKSFTNKNRKRNW